ncbi:MAG: ABC transporter substrate-binding protein [Verrucomicrobiota bacterium]
MEWRKLTIVGALIFVGSCGQKEEVGEAGSLISVKLQLDWYAEPAHGGFYQALIKGYYEEAGLAVEILQGGPGATPLQSIAVDKAQFTLGRMDDALMGVDRGLPLMVTMAYMQKDPQAIMYHASNDIDSWEDLAGKSIMVEPGSAFVAWLKKRYEIDFNIIPVDYGIARFLADENFIQQCFITSQPYFAKMKGAEVETKLLSDDEYSPERVVMTSRTMALKSPGVIRAFVSASIKGWEDYMDGDPSETHLLLNELNSGNGDELNAYSHQAMAQYKIVEGDRETGESVGRIDAENLEQTISVLLDLGLIEKEPDLSRVIDYSILPPEVSG